MSSRSRSLCSAVIASALALVSCGNSLTASPNYLQVTISPRPSSVPVGTSVVFTGNVSNNLSLPQWSFLDASDVNNPGTLSPIAGSSDTILYTAPPTPPIYSVTPTGVTQGAVTLQANVSDPAGTSIPTSSDSITFVITAPSVTLSLAPLTASVPLGGTFQFIGYAVGNLNNALTWQINGVTGGSTTTGTINVQGTYVAPVNMPMGGSTVTVTIISQADPTKTASAVITLH
jgi:hypothetical protein